MKKLSFFSMLLLAAGLLLAGGALTSCGDGDDNKDNPEGGGGTSGGGQSGTLESLIKGNTWYTVMESSDLIELEAMQYNTDGTGRGAEMKRRASDNYRQTQGESWNISYTLNGDILTITELIPGESDVNTYKVSLNSDGTMNVQRVRDGNVGKSYTYYLLPKTQDPQAALEAILDGLAARRRN